MLSVENLAYHYKGRPAVLKDVNFNVNTGEFLAILGNNGVGKSTMLKCFNKILTPDGGKIILDDENLLQMSARQVAQRVALLRIPLCCISLHILDYHRLWSHFPKCSVHDLHTMSRSYNPAGALRRQRFGLFPVRSPLLGESFIYFLFLQVLRCFSSLR